MEGVCRNLFLQSKAKIDYTELHQQLEKLCNKKKINTQKVTALCNFVLLKVIFDLI